MALPLGIATNVITPLVQMVYQVYTRQGEKC